MKVFVNPGHDPNVDSGAVNIDYDVREADVTKQAGALLERGLKRAGHEVMLLQSDDLDAVVAAANDWPADIFVSLHCNASPGRNARGDARDARDAGIGRKIVPSLPFSIQNFEWFVNVCVHFRQNISRSFKRMPDAGQNDTPAALFR